MAHLTSGLAVATLVGLVLTLLFAYLWIQLIYHIWGEITTINILYAICGLVLIVAGGFASFMAHHTVGEVLCIWGDGLIFVVMFYYLLSL